MRQVVRRPVVDPRRELNLFSFYPLYYSTPSTSRRTVRTLCGTKRDRPVPREAASCPAGTAVTFLALQNPPQLLLIQPDCSGRRGIRSAFGDQCSFLPPILPIRRLRL